MTKIDKKFIVEKYHHSEIVPYVDRIGCALLYCIASVSMIVGVVVKFYINEDIRYEINVFLVSFGIICLFISELWIRTLFNKGIQRLIEKELKG